VSKFTLLPEMRFVRPFLSEKFIIYQ